MFKKKNLTLNLPAKNVIERVTDFKDSMTTNSSILTTPDVQMLKLSSPELANFLALNPTLTTPTPTGSFSFPLHKQENIDKHDEYSTSTCTVGSNLTNKIISTGVVDLSFGDNGVKPEPPDSNSIADQNENNLPSIELLATPKAEIKSPVLQISQPLSMSILRKDEDCSPSDFFNLPVSTNPSTVFPSEPVPLPVTQITSTSLLSSSMPPTQFVISTPSDPVSTNLPPSAVFHHSLPLPKSDVKVTSIDIGDEELDDETSKVLSKRIRNRDAASRCRKRKIERISRLDEQVLTLKSENEELRQVISTLKESLEDVKCEVLSHIKKGCQISESVMLTLETLLDRNEST